MRKGQVTLFVIIGLVLLLVVGLVIMPKSNKPTSPQATEDAADVTNLIQSCLAQVGEESTRIVLLNGGYDSLEGLRMTNDKNSQIISFPPQRIPIWHEVSDCESNQYGCVNNNRPSLCAKGERCPVQDRSARQDVSFQESIERTIAKDIDACIDLQATSIPITKEGKPTVEVTIREDDIALRLIYPITITTRDGQPVDLEEFTTPISVKLPRLYRFATDIHTAEGNLHFLEESFLHLIAIYSGIDSELPPFRDLQFLGKKKMWLRKNVQTTIERDVLPFMNFVQIMNAQGSEEGFGLGGYQPLTDPDADPEFKEYADGIYEYLSIKINDEVYPLGARFEYPNTPMYLDINGKEVLKPNELGGGIMQALGGMVFTQYKFRYTASFPMIVKISDPSAFNGRGAEIVFGTEVNIKNNYPLNTSVTPLIISGTDGSLDLNDASQVVNHVYQVKVTDRKSGKPLPDVPVSYACGQEFSVGITDQSGVFTGKAPYCITGGTFIAQLEGYATATVAQDNTNDDGATTTLGISMWPLKAKVVRVYKLTASATDALTKEEVSLETLRDYRSNLSVNDSVFFDIVRQKTSPYDADVPMMRMIDFGTSGGEPQAQTYDDVRSLLEQALREGAITAEELTAQLAMIDEINASSSDGPASFTREQLIDLVPGKYELNGILTYYGDISIPPQDMGKGAMTAEQNMSQWLSGGIMLTGQNAVELTADEIYGDTTITLYVLEQSFIRQVELLCAKDGGCLSKDANLRVSCPADKPCYRVADYQAFLKSSQAMQAAAAQNPTGYNTTMMRFETAYPWTYTDLLAYKPVEEYQKYGRVQMAMPHTE